MGKKLALAIKITADVFVNKVDRGGHPYISHCLEVMNNVGDDSELKQIGVLHDVLEDTDITFKDLKDYGFSNRVLSTLVLLTHLPNVPYEEYIIGISASKDAMIVKLADLTHNSNIHRMKGLEEKDFKRLEKYHRSYAFLKEELGKI